MSTTDNTATDKRDVYASVTAQIINAIEQGVGNWRMPWHTSGRFAFSPINVTSKKPYRGINTVCLWAAAQAKGYESGEWATYKQWQERGAQVRKGEKSTLVVFWKFANVPAKPKTMDRHAREQFPPAVHAWLFRVQCRPGGRLHAEGRRGSYRCLNASSTRTRSFRRYRRRPAPWREPGVLLARVGSHPDAAVPGVRVRTSRTIRRWPMSTRIGRRTRAAAIGS